MGDRAGQREQSSEPGKSNETMRVDHGFSPHERMGHGCEMKSSPYAELTAPSMAFPVMETLPDSVEAPS